MQRLATGIVRVISIGKLTTFWKCRVRRSLKYIHIFEEYVVAKKSPCCKIQLQQTEQINTQAAIEELRIFVPNTRNAACLASISQSS